MVLAHGFCLWFLQVVLVHGFYKWFLQVVFTSGFSPWFFPFVTVNDYCSLVSHCLSIFFGVCVCVCVTPHL